MIFQKHFLGGGGNTNDKGRNQSLILIVYNMGIEFTLTMG